MDVRPATRADADRGCQVLRRSIAELCQEDHGGDPRAIAAWLANKTPDHWGAWLAQPDTSLLVAELGGQVVGVGMVDRAGTILLNYVTPDARHRGISTALLTAMEELSVERGLTVCRLQSTRTAARFYAERGYVLEIGNSANFLSKRLTGGSRPLSSERER